MKEVISKKELKNFGILIGISIPIFWGWIFPKIFGHNFREYTIWIGLSILFLSLFKPKILYYPYKFWMFFGNIMGIINSHIILGLVFIFIVQPISILMKFTGYDPLRKNLKKVEKTYREKVNYVNDLTKIF